MVYITFLRLIAAGATKGPRVPLIKFRKGGVATGKSSSLTVAKSAGSPAAAGASKKAGAAKASNAIEDWQLPARYRRAPISAMEMEYINTGGPPVPAKKPVAKKPAAKKPAGKKPAAKKTKK